MENYSGGKGVVMLVAFYNTKSLGVRYLQAALERGGFETYAVYYKGFNSQNPAATTQREVDLLRGASRRKSPFDRPVRYELHVSGDGGPGHRGNQNLFDIPVVCGGAYATMFPALSRPGRRIRYPLRRGGLCTGWPGLCTIKTVITTSPPFATGRRTGMSLTISALCRLTSTGTGSRQLSAKTPVILKTILLFPATPAECRELPGDRLGAAPYLLLLLLRQPEAPSAQGYAAGAVALGQKRHRRADRRKEGTETPWSIYISTTRFSRTAPAGSRSSPPSTKSISACRLRSGPIPDGERRHAAKACRRRLREVTTGIQSGSGISGGTSSTGTKSRRISSGRRRYSGNPASGGFPTISCCSIPSNPTRT